MLWELPWTSEHAGQQKPGWQRRVGWGRARGLEIWGARALGSGDRQGEERDLVKREKEEAQESPFKGCQG